MADFLGRSWTKDELRKRCGGIAQLAGIERVVLDDGPARGLRAAILRTGSGLQAEVLLDRGLDLGRVEFAGQALSFRAPLGEAHPAHFDPQGLGWLRTFGGGLLATCGLQNVGSPCEDEGQSHGLHGRIGATPAREVNVRAGWEGDEYRLQISGKVCEVPGLGLFGPNLCLRRTIKSALGARWIEITDEVENEGFQDSALMLLYHINVGFPIVDEGARLLAASRHVEPRDEAARPGLDGHARFEAPQPGYAEQVFFHEMIPDDLGRVQAAVVSPERSGVPRRLGLCVEYDAAALPRFIEWKMMGAGPYVVGLEPANCRVGGRADERARGTLQTLSAGERRTFRLKLSVLTGEEEIGALEKTLAQRRG